MDEEVTAARLVWIVFPHPIPADGVRVVRLRYHDTDPPRHEGRLIRRPVFRVAETKPAHERHTTIVEVFVPPESRVRLLMGKGFEDAIRYDPAHPGHGPPPKKLAWFDSESFLQVRVPPGSEAHFSYVVEPTQGEAALIEGLYAILLAIPLVLQALRFLPPYEACALGSCLVRPTPSFAREVALVGMPLVLAVAALSHPKWLDRRYYFWPFLAFLLLLVLGGEVDKP